MAARREDGRAGTLFDSARRMQKHALVPLLGLLVPLVGLLPACSSKHHHHPPEHRTPRLVSIEVEVYDPVTNQVWQDVGVRIVEAEQEWARRTFVNNDPDAWYLTDENGVVYFAPRDRALAGEIATGTLRWRGVGAATNLERLPLPMPLKCDPGKRPIGIVRLG